MFPLLYPGYERLAVPRRELRGELDDVQVAARDAVGAFTVNASLFGATRTLATAAPAAATATVPEAAFAAFAASSAFFATAAASPPAASSLNAAILLL